MLSKYKKYSFSSKVLSAIFVFDKLEHSVGLKSVLSLPREFFAKPQGEVLNHCTITLYLLEWDSFI